MYSGNHVKREVLRDAQQLGSTLGRQSPAPEAKRENRIYQKRLRRLKQIEDGKRIIMAVASGKVSRVSALVRTAVNHGSGLSAILGLMEKAAEKLYHPKGYEEEEILKGFIMLKFGGARTAAVANHAMGGASKETVRRRMKTAPMKISVLIPSVTEIQENLRSAFQVTVGCIGAIAKETRVYAARALSVSGTCKSEDGQTHPSLIQNHINACKELKDGYIMCIASDGEARRGLSFNLLTMQKPLSPSSPIYPHLRHLELMNLYVGQDDLTGDKDYKHIFKRLRNLLLRSNGVLVDGVLITPQTLESHFRDVALSEKRRSALLNPSDKQDVVLAYNLLKEINQLPPPSSSHSPTFAVARRALNLLGSLFEYLIAPYTSPKMTLSDQLTSLSAAAHILIALYTQHCAKGKFMPVQLFADIMIMIKNAYFCVAKMKAYDPEGEFWLILMGTDRLEVLFGMVRTMTGNDVNPDLLQLAGRLGDASLCAEILARFPHWDRLPRRIKIPEWTEKGEVSQKTDHINPGSWTGDVKVAHATPLTSWRSGHRKGVHILSSLRSPFDWDALKSTPNVDMLQPFGEPVLKRTSEIPPEDDEGTQLDQNNNLPRLDRPDTNTKRLRKEVDIEDLAGAADPSLESTKMTVEVDGKNLNKARVLSELFKHHRHPLSTDRLKRVADIPRFNSNTSDTSTIIDDESVFGGPMLSIHDPVATLLSVGENVFLAVGEVLTIKQANKRMDSIQTDRLKDRTITLTLRIMHLSLRTQDAQTASGNQADWEWKRTHGDTITVPARLCQLINPPVESSAGRPPTFIFQSDELRSVAASLYDSLSREDWAQIPTVSEDPNFPYRNEADEACFICEKDGVSRPDFNALQYCSYCAAKLDWTKVQLVLAHIAAHLLHDARVSKSVPRCGFCGNPDPECRFQFKPGSKALDVNKCSGCRVFNATGITQLRYGPASKSTKRSPSSNVPLKCPLCPAKAPLVWKYSLVPHLQQVHRADPQKYESHWKLGPSEEKWLKKVYNNRLVVKRTTQKTFASKQKRTMKISEAHSSRLAGTEREEADENTARPTRTSTESFIDDDNQDEEEEEAEEGEDDEDGEEEEMEEDEGEEEMDDEDEEDVENEAGGLDEEEVDDEDSDRQEKEIEVEPSNEDLNLSAPLTQARQSEASSSTSGAAAASSSTHGDDMEVDVSPEYEPPHQPNPPPPAIPPPAPIPAPTAEVDNQGRPLPMRRLRGGTMSFDATKQAVRRVIVSGRTMRLRASGQGDSMTEDAGSFGYIGVKDDDKPVADSRKAEAV
ncbi:hypothetical protein SISNIDRAFT_469824 [Sistotremastrum niveocremeum HHB9708]|uniref:Uncharacterized protein n=1 Tax=Sistotremastrum niveocremeum HHB9708 TaxID=1314777 RepID=A0A164PHR8_9AGAM|nr:hypothetical protein SISNIDRAFT_469824 [Sistotremastrum niveocremeum HHB9708]